MTNGKVAVDVAERTQIIPFHFRVLKNADELKNVLDAAPSDVQIVVLRKMVGEVDFIPRVAFMLTSPKMRFGQEFYIAALEMAIDFKVVKKSFFARLLGLFKK